MAYRILAVPAGVGPREAYDTMIAAIDADGELPLGYDVEWQWRNAPHLPMRSDDFATVVRESSRGGFLGIMRERLEGDRDRVVAMMERKRAGAKPARRRAAPRRARKGKRR